MTSPFGLGADPARLLGQYFDAFTDQLDLTKKRVDLGAATHRVLDGPAHADIDESVAQLPDPSVVSNLVDALGMVPQKHKLDVNDLGRLLQRVEEGNSAVAGDGTGHHVNT